ncbi:uncharacterized protein LOC141714124 [Apium graveolens]|uniref:uncharacterized protein LOC141714124 n=1 Tax=Apium graveolens TaxID=4045 RepID=UPI003D7B8487
MPEFAYDVLGVVEDERLNVISVDNMYGDRKQLKFKISDGRRSEKVIVWGELANSVKDMILEEKVTPKIIILTSTKVHMHMDEVQINTLPSTKVYINYDNEHVISMRERYEKKMLNTSATKSAQTSQRPRIKVEFESMDLKKLMSIKDEAYINKEVLCRAKICKVKEEHSWWYKSCIFCQSHVKQVDDGFKCTNTDCAKSMPSPEKRFRILVLVEDGVEACNFLLLDRAAKRIVGSTAVKIKAELDKKSNANDQTPDTAKSATNATDVHLPREKPPPDFLAVLLSNPQKSLHYKKNIKRYNTMFAMTSTGGIVDREINNGYGPHCYIIYGQNHHNLGCLQPGDGQSPRFCQLYIYDTENKVGNRKSAINGDHDDEQVDKEIVEGLLKMLDRHNNLVKAFRQGRDRVNNDESDDFKLVLISSISQYGRPNHISPTDEVAGFIVGADEDTKKYRDVIVQTKQGFLKRVYETFHKFMTLQYPLLFPYGDDGYHLKIPYKTSVGKCSKKKVYITMREYYAYQLMIRNNPVLILRQGGRLFQQFVVDAYTTIEQYKLNWVRDHQQILRLDQYSSVREALSKGNVDPAHIGKGVIIPASFTGSKRYMTQYFQDSLAICKNIGHPTFFLTMTCNSKWPEIQRMLDMMPGVKVEDAPDVVARVFKLKLDQLVNLIKKENYFGNYIGLAEIDKIISAEMPDQRTDPIGYQAVSQFMVHGPCGSDRPTSPCINCGKCIRHFPKRRRVDPTTKENTGYVDNKYVVPYNRDLLVRFQCHINLEFYNNSRAIKYLFKYCLKGQDTANMMLKRIKNKKKNSTPDGFGANSISTKSNGSAKVKKKDEINEYLDGRYICASEASWRTFSFDIHYRFPVIERLPVHLKDHQHLSFDVNMSLDDIECKAVSRKSKLEAWFEANNKFEVAQKFTYEEFTRHFVWDNRNKTWKVRSRGTMYGRLPQIPAQSGEAFYLRKLLTKLKDCRSWDDL